MEDTRKILSAALGMHVPKSMLVRMLLGRALQAFETSLHENPRVALTMAAFMDLSPEERIAFDRRVRADESKRSRDSETSKQSASGAARRRRLREQ